jgi:hypothetical protein
MNSQQWKKQMLAAPSLSVLNAVQEVLQDPTVTLTLQQALAAAISENHRVSVPGSPSASLAVYAAVTDVRVEYIRQIRQHSFGAAPGCELLSTWWFAGNRKSDRANRVKALQGFIDAAIKAGKKQNTVFKVYLDGSAARVVEAVRVSATKSRITVLGANGQESTERITCATHVWRDTWEGASQVLIAFARERLEDARRVLQQAQAYEGNCRGLKRKSAVAFSEDPAPAKQEEKAEETTAPAPAAPVPDDRIVETLQDGRGCLTSNMGPACGLF